MLFEIVHRTEYHYAQPVTFGQHRGMLRPRDSHDLRLHDTLMRISPNASVTWLHDVFSNSVVLFDFAESARELVVESRLLLESFASGVPLGAPLGERHESYPFLYPPDLLPDLANTHVRHYPDPEGKVAAWARRFVDGSEDSAQLLARMMEAIKSEFAYQARDEVGTQPPAETLALGRGTCRDYALFMMEAARSLGFAARFVTGYLYDPAIDGQGAGIAGAGATHAWVQIFLPRSGWVEYDPTNALIGASNLIRVGVARDPCQAVPLTGTWTGAPSDYLGMDVSVTVSNVAPGTMRLAA